MMFNTILFCSLIKARVASLYAVSLNFSRLFPLPRVGRGRETEETAEIQTMYAV